MTDNQPRLLVEYIPEWSLYSPTNEEPRRMLLELSVVGGAEQTTVPLELVVVMDLSGSMQPYMHTMHRIMEFFVHTMASKGAPGSSLAVLGFNANSHILLPRTPVEHVTQQHCQEMVGLIRPSGCTDVALGLCSGLDLFAATATSSQVMVVISDGQSTRGEMDCEQIHRMVSAHPKSTLVPIHICTIGSSCSFDMLNRIAASSPGGVLQELEGSDPRPARSLGLMLGLAMYQHATDVQLSLYTAAGVPDVRGSTRVGNMSVGEKRIFCMTVPPTAVQVDTVVAYQSPDGESMRTQHVRTSYVIPTAGPEQEGWQDVTVMAEFTLQDIMQRLDESKVDATDILEMQRGALEAYTSLAPGETADRLERLQARLGLLLLTLDQAPLQRERVARSMTNEFVRQRSSTYEGVECAEADGPPPSTPILARAISVSANAYLNEESSTPPFAFSPLAVRNEWPLADCDHFLPPLLLTRKN
jgi:hypothetical protein